MNDFNELNISTKRSDVLQQDKFNSRFLIKLTFFVFFYRFYIMYIDQKAILVNSIEKFLNQFHEELD